MIKPDEISTMLTNESIDFVLGGDDDEIQWLVFYSFGVIVIDLMAAGEHLRIRTGPIADPSEVLPDDGSDLYRRAMLANDHVMIGRYCGVDEIYFEIGMAFPGQSSLSTDQLVLCIRTAASIGCVGTNVL